MSKKNKQDKMNSEMHSCSHNNCSCNCNEHDLDSANANNSKSSSSSNESLKQNSFEEKGE